MKRLAFVLVVTMMVAASAIAETGREIIDASGIKGGVIVHLGCGDGNLTAELYANESYMVNGLDTQSVNITKARAYIRSRNLYGPVSVARYNGKNLPYGDNIVNLIVADTLGDVSIE